MIKRILAVILFTAGLATLVALGVWQHQRLQWKNAIIATLDRQYATLESKSSILSRARIEDALASADAPFLADKAAGRLRRDKTVFIGPRIMNDQSGYDVVVPMAIDDGTLLIDLGWIADKDRAALKLPNGTVIASGVVRQPDAPFASKNSPANDLWFQIDIGQIGAARHLDRVAPMVLYAQSTAPSIKHVIPHEAHWLPRNKHHQYMLFWFGMAGAWVAVFALAWMRQRQG